jgi:hypothetical protein
VSGAPDSEEDHYWKKIAELIDRYAPSGGIIAHEKSMELHLKNYALPEDLIIYTRDTRRRVRIEGREVAFRVLASGEKTGRKNMFQVLLRSSVRKKIDGIELCFLGPEAALLDVLSMKLHEEGIADALISRFLRLEEKRLSRVRLGELVKYRYIRAINRLRVFSETHGFERLHEITLDVIKKEGGNCFVSY